MDFNFLAQILDLTVFNVFFPIFKVDLIYINNIDIILKAANLKLFYQNFISVSLKFFSIIGDLISNIIDWLIKYSNLLGFLKKFTISPIHDLLGILEASSKRADV